MKKAMYKPNKEDVIKQLTKVIDFVYDNNGTSFQMTVKASAEEMPTIEVWFDGVIVHREEIQHSVKPV